MAKAKLRCPIGGCKSRLLNNDTLILHLKLRHPAEWEKQSGQRPWPQRTCRIYLRVSSADQDPSLQRASIKAYLGLKGVPAEQQHWYDEDGEGETGTTMERPGIMRLLGDLERGDVFVLTHPDRLARNTGDFIALTHAIKARGGDIYATDCPIDTTDHLGLAFWRMLGIFAELEWHRIVSRTMAGAEAARAKGNPGGRHRNGCGTLFPCPTGIHTRENPYGRKSRARQATLSPASPGVAQGA